MFIGSDLNQSSKLAHLKPSISFLPPPQTTNEIINHLLDFHAICYKVFFKNDLEEQEKELLPR